jgi:hypothetical protein
MAIRAIRTLPTRGEQAGSSAADERAALTAWALTRIASLTLSLVWARDAVGWVDLGVYSRWARATAMGATPSFTLDEYPPLARLLLVPLGLAPTRVTFAALFIVAMAVADLLVLRSLAARARDTRCWTGVWCWSVLPSFLGPVLWTRYDLVPALMVVLALTRATGTARGAWLAAGAATKLWPVALLPALLLDRRRLRTLTAFGLAAPALFVGPWLLIGGQLDRSITWGLDRGLQVESTAGSMLALAGSLRSLDVRVTFAYGAWEVHGEGVATISQVLPVLAAGMLITALLVLRRAAPDMIRMHGRHGSVALGALLLLLVVLLSSKVLSPQYMVWLLAVGSICLSQARVTRPRQMLVCLALVAALSHLVYPLWYLSVVELHGAGPVLLATRNATMFVLLGLVTSEMLGHASSTRPGDDCLQVDSADGRRPA